MHFPFDPVINCLAGFALFLVVFYTYIAVLMVKDEAKAGRGILKHQPFYMALSLVTLGVLMLITICSDNLYSVSFARDRWPKSLALPIGDLKPMPNGQSGVFLIKRQVVREFVGRMAIVDNLQLQATAALNAKNVSVVQSCLAGLNDQLQAIALIHPELRATADSTSSQ